MFGICKKCKVNEYSDVGWCKSCDPVNSVRTGNDAINEFLRNTLQSANSYEKVVEWIQFDKLKDIDFIGKGGFSEVFSATWIDGERKEIDEKGEKRGKELKVALKKLNDSKNISDTFLEEIQLHHKYSTINLYGLTQDADSNYMMVLKFADNGSLQKYLISNFKNLDWKKKLFFLHKIADELILIHKKGNVHRDFHNGNILVHSNHYPCISDLGLAGPANKTKGKEVYGVLPYVAPEVLCERPYTTASDIYSFGIIMTEFSSGELAHGNYSHDISLALRIIEGLRPKFGKGTPERYIELANRCMDADPSKRPIANECYELLNYWCDTLRYDSSTRDKDVLIRNEFLAANKMIPELQRSQINSGAIYTSQLLSQRLDLGSLQSRYLSKITPTPTPTSEDFKFPSEEEESPSE